MTEVADGIDLLSLSPAAGCACKVPMSRLNSMLSFLESLGQEDGDDAASVQVGLSAHDDAAVHRINPGLSLIHSVDFGTPVSADPFVWGRIAAANALSDVYAMGGSPVAALSVLGWPARLATEPVDRIMQGAVSMLGECPATLTGGHTIASDVPLFGMCVLGTVAPEHLMLNANAHPGQRLLLTKPLGTGVIVAAEKSGLASREAISSAEHVMMASNKAATRLCNVLGINAGTDVTGYGFAGHLANLLKASKVSAEIRYQSVPVLDHALDIIRNQGLVPNGAERNYFDLECQVEWADTPLDIRFAMCDPQTSGGLLIAAYEGQAQSFLKRARALGVPVAEVGFVTEGMPGTARIVGNG